MKESRLTKRYAKALFDFAVEKKLEKEVFEDMVMLSDACDASPDFRRILSSPIIKADKKLAIFKSLFESKMNKISLAYLQIILRKRRESYIDGIAEQYQKEYRASIGIKTVFIKTPVAIDETIKEKVKALVKKQTGCETELIEQIQKNLIGGFVLTIDDMQYDASFASKIQKLNKEFNLNIYEKRL